MMKLLVADDSELIRSRLVGMLDGIVGIDAIDTADTLAQTLTAVQAKQPTLLILDLHLPDGNAMQILPELKQLSPGMEIVVLTNDDSAYNRKRCLQAGADWFFDKPTEFEKALMLVQLQAAANAENRH
jgi:two-component system OmpR family response regulator